MGKKDLQRADVKSRREDEDVREELRMLIQVKTKEMESQGE